MSSLVPTVVAGSSTEPTWSNPSCSKRVRMAADGQFSIFLIAQNPLSRTVCQPPCDLYPLETLFPLLINLPFRRVSRRRTWDRACRMAAAICRDPLRQRRQRPSTAVNQNACQVRSNLPERVRRPTVTRRPGRFFSFVSPSGRHLIELSESFGPARQRLSWVRRSASAPDCERSPAIPERYR